MPLIVMLILIVIICTVGAIINRPSNETRLSEIPNVISEDGEILASETNIEHDCKNYLISKYDTTNHWNECSICGTKYNITDHIYTETWTMGDSCSLNNKCNHVCSCGYSYQSNNTREHKNIKFNISVAEYYHAEICLDCGSQISRGDCTKADGTRITCNNLGTCNRCGQIYSQKNHKGTIYNKEGDVKCDMCNKYIGTFSNLETNLLANTFEFSYDLSVSSTGNLTNCYAHKWGQLGVTFEEYEKTENNRTSINVTGKAILPNQEKTFNMTSYISNYDVTADDHVSICVMAFHGIKPDTEAPVINNIVQADLATSETWATQKQLTITGTENYCSSIKLTMKDSEGNTYLNNASVAVTNNNWTYTFIPDIEADENGKEFTITAVDSLGNSSEQKFMVYKTDKKAPTLTSASETSKDWTKTKDFTITATDSGSGGVEIAVNNINEYILATKTGTTYSRPYTFTEEINGSKTYTIYLKDGLGNATSKTLAVYNIDSTPPTIQKCEIINNEIVLTGNDYNETLKAEGSGIAEYRYIGSSSENETDVETRGQSTTTNKISLSELKNVKYAYIVAIDRAGNISQKQKIELPTYKITVNPNGGTWKGVNASTEETGYYNGQTIKIELPTRQGYTFEGWEVTRGAMNESKTEYTFTTSNASLRARWNLITPEVGNNVETIVTANKMDENGTPKLTKEDGEISYRINYTTGITNYIGKAKIEIVSNLSAKINTDKSELAGGRYNQNTNTITWTEEIENINTFSNGNYTREIPKQITVVYENQNVTQGLLNTVIGKTITYYPEGYENKGGQEFIRAEKEATDEVKQEYTVNFKTQVKWEDNEDRKKKRPETVIVEISVEDSISGGGTITKTLSKEDNWTYEEKGLPKYNAQGEEIKYKLSQKETEDGNLEYYENPIIEKLENQTQEATNYIYEITNEYKLMNTDLNTEITINGTEEIEEKESSVEYTINLKSEITDYIGEGKIKIENILPYRIDIEKSDIQNGIYDENRKTMTWEEELPHINTEETKQNYNINETKQITLVYKDIDLTQEKMTSNVKGKIELYETEEKDEKTANQDTQINIKGKVIVKYIDKDTNQEIINGYEIIDKIGRNYTTEKKEIEGYDYIGSTENETGKIKEKDTEVIYYYQVPRTKVTVKYQDRKGNDIIEKTEIEGLLGDKYKTEKKEIEKYEYIETKGNPEGEMTREGIEIIYVYEKTGTITVKYIDIDTNQEIIKINNMKTDNEENENTETENLGAALRENFMEQNSFIKNRPQSETYKYQIIGIKGEEYETEQKEIPYYKFIKSTENTKGKLEGGEETVIYYYRKLDFNIGIEKEVESISLNEEGIGVTNKKLEKIEIKSKEIDKTELIVKYNIKVTNKGELEGTAKIEEQIPQGYKLAYISEDWKQNIDGTLETNVNLEAGETKILRIALEWKNNENNLGSRTSTSKIANTENSANYEDTEEKDNTSEITIITSIKTGEVVSNMIIMIIVLSLGIFTFISMAITNKKGIKIKDIKFLK